MTDKSFLELKNRSLFARLKKLFSDEVIIRNMGGKKLKVIDVHSIEYASDRSSLRDRFNRLRVSTTDNYSRDFNLAFQRNRVELFRDYDTMDMDPILHSALDVYADESTVLNEMGELVKVYSSNEDIHDTLDNLFNDILNVKFNLWSWVRSLCKYGDFYLRLYISPDYGIYTVKPYSAYNVTRIENSDLSNRNYVKFQVTIPEGNRMEELENYEMIHFRLISDSNFLPQGLSMLEGGRRAWKQLCCNSLSQIWTDKGYKYIKDINIGDNIYCFNPDTLLTEKTRVAKIARTSLSAKTVTIKTRNRELTVTPDHKLLVKTNKGDLVYKEAQEILTNHKNGKYKADKLVFPVVHGGKKIYTLYLDPEDYCVRLNQLGREIIRKLRDKLGKHDFYITKDGKNLTKPKSLYHLLYRFFFIEKGTLSYNLFKEIKDNYNLTFDHVDLYYRNKETHQASIYESIIDKETLSFTVDAEFCRAFGFMLGDGWISQNGIAFASGIYEECNQRYLNILSKYNGGRYYYKYRYSPNCEQGTGNYEFNTVELQYIFKKLGFISGFNKKCIPDWIWDMDIECRRNMIIGLFDADGSWKYGTLGLSNFELINQAKNLADQCGIMTSMVRTATKKAGYDKRGIYKGLSWRLQIDFKHQYDIFYQKVTNITENEKEDEVWNLTTESPLHNYVLNGIVSKNCLLEDAMMISRIMRAPEKRVFKIDVGNTPPNEIENLMTRISNQMTKTPYVDNNTGEYNLRYNMQNMIQDYFLPVRGGQTGTTIETLPGLQWNGIEDVEYIRNKMMAALKIPKAFLGYEEETGDRATLAQMDVRFCRTIQRIQKFVLSGLTEIALVHLYSLGYRDEKLLDFELELASPSTIFEKEKLEIFKNKTDLCQSMQEQKLFSKKWMYQNIFGMSDQDIIELQKELIDDSKANYRFSQIENEGSDPVLKFLKTQHKNYSGSKEGESSDDLSSVSGLGSDSSFEDMSSDDEMFGSDEFGEEGGEEGEAGEETPENNKETKKNISETEKWKSPFNKHKNHNRMVQKKWDAERDQTGRKDASKYNFTEDPLGDVEMNRKSKNKIKMENSVLNSMENQKLLD